VLVAARHEGNDVVITTTYPPRNGFLHPMRRHGDVDIQYWIYAPRDSKVTIQHNGGDTNISGMRGEIYAKVTNGQITRPPGQYSTDAESKFGQVYSDFEGHDHRRHVIGDECNRKTNPGLTARGWLHAYQPTGVSLGFVYVDRPCDNLTATPRRRSTMRMMVQMSIPVEAGNDAARNGTLGQTIQKIIAALKPEAAYFTATEHGERGGFMIFDMQDTSQIPAVAEPLFLAFKAKLKFMPVMNAQDLANAMPAIEKSVKEYGKAA
jgi:hypothetical protein